MISGRQDTGGLWRGGGWSLPPLFCLALFAVASGSVLVAPVSAQMFTDRPPPVPPASVPEPPAGPAMNLAPPSGPTSIPNLPAPLTQPSLTQPSIAAVPPVIAPPGASSSGQAVLALTARFGKDLPVIN